MKNKEDNTRKRRTNHQPTCQSPADSKLTDGTIADSIFRQVLGDVSNLKPNLQSSGGSQHFTQPSTYFGSGNPYYGAFSLPMTLLSVTVFYSVNQYMQIMRLLCCASTTE